MERRCEASLGGVEVCATLPIALPAEDIRSSSFLKNEYKSNPPVSINRLNNEETLDENNVPKRNYSFLFL